VDDFDFGFVSGVCAFGLVAVVVMALYRWVMGSSKDTLPLNEPPSDTDPDLRPAVIEYAMEEAAAQVVSYGLTQNEYRAARTRLRLAVRAKRGDALSDIELGVLLGVLPAPVSQGTRKDVQPVAQTGDAV
jgi:hypothetical protein